MHREITEITDRPPQLIGQLLEVWERSVRATHLFLSAGEVAEIKPYVPQALREVPHLIVARRADGTPVGFLGIDGQKLEMLFLARRSGGGGWAERSSDTAWSALASGRSRSTSRTPRPGAFMSAWAFASASGGSWTSRAGPIRS